MQFYIQIEKQFNLTVMALKSSTACRVLKDLGMWLPQLFTYEDGIDSSLSTATRSMCRSKVKLIQTQEDWHIVPTSNATFGKRM